MAKACRTNPFGRSFGLFIEWKMIAIARREGPVWACQSPPARCICITERSRPRTRKTEGCLWRSDCQSTKRLNSLSFLGEGRGEGLDRYPTEHPPHCESPSLRVDVLPLPFFVIDSFH